MVTARTDVKLAANRSRLSRRKKTGLAIAAVVGLLLLVVLACEWAGWPFLRQPLESQLSQKLERKVELGEEFRLHLLGSLRVSTNHFHIAAPNWQPAVSTGTDFFSASDVKLVLPWRSVFGSLNGQRLQISLLEAGRLDALLIREKDGRANWVFSGPPENDEKESGKTTAIPRFGKLIVKSGQLHLRDEISTLKIEARASTQEGAQENRPGLIVTADGSFQNKVFRARATSPGLLPLVAPEGRSTPIGITASVEMGGSRLNFDGFASDLLQFGGLSGDFSLAGPSLAAVGDAVGATLPTTAPFTMTGRVQKQKSLWTLNVGEFAVGTTRLSGLFHYDTAASRPRLAGELRGSQLALADLAPALGAPVADIPAAPVTAGQAPGAPAATSIGKQASGRILPQREFDISSLQRMDADIAINLDKVIMGRVFAQPLAPLQGHLALNRGELKLDRLLARTADGELRGELLLDSRREQPLWASNLAWSGVKLEKWLRPRNELARKSERLRLKKPAGATAPPPFVSGELGGQAKLHGSGKSTAAMLASLQGSTQIWVKDGEVSQLVLEGSGLDAAQALGLLVRGDKNVELRCAALGFKADKGTLKTETGIVDTADTLLLLNGNISLVDEKLDLTLRAKPHDASPLSLRAPLYIRGSFSAPRVRPDAGTVGLKVGAAALLGIAVSPFAAIIPLIDPGSSDKGGSCQQTLARLQAKPGTPADMKQALQAKR